MLVVITYDLSGEGHLMAEIRLLPRFLTVEVARLAVDTVLTSVFESESFRALLSRGDCHVVVLVPSMTADREEGYPNWPNYQTEPHCLFEKSVGNKASWKAPFHDIAQCKALQLWQERNDDRSDIMPHLLFPGDVPFWGGVRRHGIVVACSGVQPYFDKMISGMIADMCVALAYDAWMRSADREQKLSVLT